MLPRGRRRLCAKQIQAFEDAQDAIQRQGRAYQELQDPLGEYLKNLAALNAVLAQHPELADQAAGAQDKLQTGVPGYPEHIRTPV